MTLMEYFNTTETLLPEELIFGAVRVAEAPSVHHQRVVLRMAIALEAHAQRTASGEVFVAPIDIVFDRERALVLQPDISFVSTTRSDLVSDRIYGAPDLVVEVLSPQPRIGSLRERLEWFIAYGVREVWLYHQFDRRLTVVTGDGGRTTGHRVFEFADPIRSDVLPEFTLSMQMVLERA